MGRFQRALFLPSPSATIPAVALPQAVVPGWAAAAPAGAAKPAEQPQADGQPGVVLGGDRSTLDPRGSSSPFDRRRHPSVIDAPARPAEDPTTIGSERRSAGPKP